MIIVKEENKTKYICSICKHTHEINTDGTTVGQPFIPHERKIMSYKFWEDNSALGKRMMPHPVHYTGYICPSCGKLQVTEQDAKDINSPFV